MMLSIYRRLVNNEWNIRRMWKEAIIDQLRRTPRIPLKILRRSIKHFNQGSRYPELQSNRILLTYEPEILLLERICFVLLSPFRPSKLRFSLIILTKIYIAFIVSHVLFLRYQMRVRTKT
jgi:hypothetical protein